MDRFTKVQNLMKKAEEISANQDTMTILLTTMTDKALSKFYKDFMEKGLGR